MTTKTIVMSDLHVSNCAPYAWCKADAVTDICDMLYQVASDPSVGELVFLGDVFDLWVYPVDVVPCKPTDIIALQPQWIAAMQACVAKLPAVCYLLGNHDMAVTAADLQAFAAGGKCIQLLTKEAYMAGHPGLHLEHGHDADMFNAPYDESDGIGGFPLGFFISRLVAHSTQPGRTWQRLRDALTGHFTSLHQAKAALLAQPESKGTELDPFGKALVELIIDVLVLDTGVSENAVIRFSDPSLDRQNLKVKDVKFHYWKLLRKWVLKEGLAVIDAALVSVRDHGLDWYARRLERSNPKPSAVVLGHTHHSELVDRYANDGYWFNTSAQTYVSIENGTASVITFPEAEELPLRASAATP